MGTSATIPPTVRRLSQKLMRMRVLLQFIAIVATMTTLWMVGQHWPCLPRFNSAGRYVPRCLRLTVKVDQ